jgi:hypothetical protein
MWHFKLIFYSIDVHFLAHYIQSFVNYNLLEHLILQIRIFETYNTWLHVYV